MMLEEDQTMDFEDEFQPEGNEFPINDYDNLQLASDSTKKSTKPLRPLSGKHHFSSRETDSEPSPKSSVYVERRRKCMKTNLNTFLKESEATTRMVKRGISYFGILSQEMCDKVNHFWSERAKYEQASRSRILPPNRKYLSCCTETLESSGSRSGQYTSKDMTTQFIQAERLLEAEEAENDKLLTMEPEIVDLTQQIIQNGPSLLDALMSRDSKSMLSSNSTPTSDLKKSGDTKPNFVSQSVERRRNRLQNQWFDEQPRPFTPRFLNISRPQVGPMLSAKTSADTKETSLASEVEHSDCSGDDYHDHDQEMDTTKADESSGIKTASSGDEVTETTASKQFSVFEILNAQLSSLVWLLEQMISVDLEKHTYRKAISTSWRSDAYSSVLPTSERVKSHLANTCDPNTNQGNSERSDSPERAWIQFVGGFKVNQKYHEANGQYTAPRGSSKSLSRRTTPSVRSAKTACSDTQSTNDEQPCRLRRVVSVIKAGYRFKRERNAHYLIATPDRTDTSTPAKQRMRSARPHRAPPTLMVPETVLMAGQKTVQFNKPSRMPGSTDNTKENCKRLTLQHWVTVHELRERYSKDVLSEMARNIELEMDKENSQQNTNRVPRIIRSAPAKVTSVAIPEEKLSRFKSAQWSRLAKTMRSQLLTMTEEMSMEFQDRMECMRQLRAKISLNKYQSIPNRAPTYLAIQQIQHKVSYADAVNMLASRQSEQRQYAPWYVDLLHDLDDLQSDTKISSVLKRLEYFALLSSGQFTVFNFTRILRYLTSWELCSPAVSAAIDFVRSRVLDMTLDEYIDWLYSAHPELKRSVE
ncbi:hypothetical protein EG68_04177 [Paragonimus skrjabini miyazakii]|uniref:Coiled-coil domain-containing protein 60 n=1 Tax=Paragonimus skrjabini miyazakii TaxID=59628 RepID=A0A8S9Z6P9_9TREM|nr:hypothetical protein EG68_04177 [Paragonimus skrjabini miyazakii]